MPFPKQLKVDEKTSATPRFFNPLLGVWKSDEALFCMFVDYITWKWILLPWL